MVERAILKCIETGEDIDLALLALQTTPLSSKVASPVELLNGRVFKSTLEGRSIQREINKTFEIGRDTKELPQLHKGKVVYLQDPTKKDVECRQSHRSGRHTEVLYCGN